MIRMIQKFLCWWGVKHTYGKDVYGIGPWAGRITYCKYCYKQRVAKKNRSKR